MFSSLRLYRAIPRADAVKNASTLCVPAPPREACVYFNYESDGVSRTTHGIGEVGGDDTMVQP
jgi:hypothetical protein